MKSKLLTSIGELLVLAGCYVGGFLAWQLNEEQLIASTQGDEAEQLVAYWAEKPEGGFQAEVGWQQPDLGRGFAVLRIPKLGNDYQKIIAEGTGYDVLNDRKLGIGHYPGTA